MSQVLDSVDEAERRPKAEILADIEAKGLAKVIREETWVSHGRAEFSGFEQALVKGTITKPAYAELLAQTYFIYVAVEEVGEKLANDRVVGPFIQEELLRLPAIEADLEFYFGAGWRDIVKPLPVTDRYVARIHEAAKENPALYVPHHYTRYLADLSGGFMIDKGITQAFGLEDDGRRFYVFDKIENPTEFKNHYRTLLDELPVSDDEKLAVIDEALRAYAYNIELIEELSERTAPYEVAAG